jgi:tetratricopeptide (TPR) repeat protein
LQDYFEVEGLAYRLMPYKVKSHDGQLGEVNTQIMYDNMINKFKWGNMNGKGVYLDETNLRMTMNLRNNFYRLATALFQEGEKAGGTQEKVLKDKALKCLDKTEELMPDNVVAYNYFNLLIAELYYKLDKPDKAKQMVQTLKERTEIDVAYYARVANKKIVADDYNRAKQILALCDQLLAQISAGTTNMLESTNGKVENDSLPIDTPNRR